MSWINHDGLSVPIDKVGEQEGGCQIDMYTTYDSFRELDVFHKWILQKL